MSTPTISQLDADQLTRHAFNVFVFQGRHQVGAQLCYRALQLQLHNAAALRNLSDLLDNEGTELFSAVVLEYALSAELQLATNEWQMLDDLRFLAKWTWGFARHRHGSLTLAKEDFADRSAFEVDEARYQAFLAQLVEPAGTLQAACGAAHTLCGVMGGLLQHRVPDTPLGFDALLHPTNFIPTDAYTDWLHSTTTALDELEQHRQAQSE